MSSAGVILLGSHTLQTYTRKQQIIARNIADADVHATTSETSESKGMVSLCVLGYEMKTVLAIDAKATEHVLHRQGIGRLKHTK